MHVQVGAGDWGVAKIGRQREEGIRAKQGPTSKYLFASGGASG